MSKTIILGRGTFGVVEKKANLAIKRIVHNDELIKFPLEFSIMKTYKHPYLNFAIDVRFTDVDIAIYQNFADCNLSEYIEKHGSNEVRTKRWSYQLLSAIFFLHTQDIIHCDIKPPNILIFCNDIRLTDFGFARLSSDMIVPRETVGTLKYCSPEQLLTGIWDKPADIWAFGCVVYEMATTEMLIQQQTSTQKQESAKKNALRFKVAKSIQEWLISRGHRIVPRIGTIRYNPIVYSSKTPLEIQSLTSDCFHWNPENRKTADELLRLPYFACENTNFPYSINFPVEPGYSNAFVDKCTEEITVYLADRNLSKISSEMKKELIRLYVRTKNNIPNRRTLVIEGCLLIIFSLFHYPWDSFLALHTQEKLFSIQKLIFDCVDFQIHTPL